MADAAEEGVGVAEGGFDEEGGGGDGGGGWGGEHGVVRASLGIAGARWRMSIIDASVLQLFPSASGTSASLLSALYGQTGSGASGVDPISALQTAEAGETKDVAAVAAQPQTARDIAAFKAALASAKSPADLLKNPVALKVLLTANGLGSQAGYTALASKALLSDTSKAGSLASTLSNPLFLATAKTYDFANKGLSVLRGAVAGVAQGYAEVQWRTDLDASTPGLSNALDFRSRASTISSVDQILGDPTLRTVVTTALGIPEQIAFQPLEAQEKAISSRVDLAKFGDAKFVEQFARRYLIAAGAAASSSASTGVVGLFA